MVFRRGERRLAAPSADTAAAAATVDVALFDEVGKEGGDGGGCGEGGGGVFEGGGGTTSRPSCCHGHPQRV